MSHVDRKQLVLALVAMIHSLGDTDSECNGEPLGIKSRRMTCCELCFRRNRSGLLCKE